MKFVPLAFAPTILSSCSKEMSSSRAVSLCMAVNSQHSHQEGGDSRTPSRRSFLRQKASIATSAAFYGFLVNFDSHEPNCSCMDCVGSDTQPHGESCQCNGCTGNLQHQMGCSCKICSIRLGPLPANAYDRDVGDESRSPETYAMNLQAKKTNARLEASGFKLDTKEEESSRLSDALASFSYDSIAGRGLKTDKATMDKGFKTNKDASYYGSSSK